MSQLRDYIALKESQLIQSTGHLFPDEDYFGTPLQKPHTEQIEFLVGLYNNIAEATHEAIEAMKRKKLSPEEIHTHSEYYTSSFRITEHYAFWTTERRLRELGRKEINSDYSIARIDKLDRQKELVKNLQKHEFEFPQIIHLRKNTIDDAFNAHAEHLFLSPRRRNFLLTGKH